MHTCMHALLLARDVREIAWEDERECVYTSVGVRETKKRALRPQKIGKRERIKKSWE